MILPHMQSSYSVYAYDELGSSPPKRASLTLFIRFEFTTAGAPFRQAPAEIGYEEGRNVAIEYRVARHPAFELT
jgi:hypothetical protein